MSSISIYDNHADDHVELEIQECLTSVPPKSFFMFAGAGSGKTRSLINTLKFIQEQKGEELLEYGKQIAIITYTNAACDEIDRRLQYSKIFYVATIHKFLWDLIKNYQIDIKRWIEMKIQSDLDVLYEKRSKARGINSIQKKDEEIKRKEERLKNIRKVNRFIYNPNGTNVGIESLSHDEVIKIGSDFIFNEETMQKIIISKFPILLIDESQDTKKELVDALISIYINNKKNWIMGMFGDSMQKIYMDGKDDLYQSIPKDWKILQKIMNHRSAKRIVKLANQIRKPIDGKEQRARSDVIEGNTCLFITRTCENKDSVERKVAEKMRNITDDQDWTSKSGYKCLILEHHMAASRFGFNELYSHLNDAKVFDTSLRDGTISEIFFLANVISPLIKAYKNQNDFLIEKILRKYCPLLNSKKFNDNGNQSKEKLSQVEEAAENLFELWKDEKIPRCIDVINSIYNTRLFDLNDRVIDILNENYHGKDKKVLALKKALMVPFDELERYYAYVSEETKFATHQGVKGLEFPRIMVILDDEDSKGFLFSYEKLFKVKEKTETDLKNEHDGKDTSITRTSRLFYVACTRAQKSLAVVVYSKNPDKVKETAIENNWFKNDEIIMLE